jgi:DNA replication and repair protein RecF
VRLRSLRLTNFRNLRRLELELPAGVHLFIGDNAQGKTNLLEAVHLLSAMRAFRAETDAQVVGWEGLAEGSPLARLVGEVERAAGPFRIELVVTAREGAGSLQASKTVRVNGVPRRLQEAVGLFLAVLFTVEDIDLLTGPPALRRRLLDGIIAQTDHEYLLARQRLDKVLLQRNHLLRRLRERAAQPEELAFWDETLASDAAYIVWARARAVAELDRLTRETGPVLGETEELRLVYRPRLGPSASSALGGPVEGLAEGFLQDLRRGLRHEIAAGMTLLGPQRDDVEFQLAGAPVAGYASRAQQRSVALVLRLAEARYLQAVRHETPVLLLDDVLSEMDGRRRARVVEALAPYEQVFLTATDTSLFPAALLARAWVYLIFAGEVRPATSPAAP